MAAFVLPRPPRSLQGQPRALPACLAPEGSVVLALAWSRGQGVGAPGRGRQVAPVSSWRTAVPESSPGTERRAVKAAVAAELGLG